MTDKPLNRISIAFCVIVICGCGTPYQPGNYMEGYQAESRLLNLERTDREARIGQMFPDTASKPSY